MTRRVLSSIVFLILISSFFAPVKQDKRARAQAGTRTIYDDEYQNGWYANGTAGHDESNIDPVYGGIYSLAVDFGSRQSLYIRHGGIYTHDYTHLSFYVNGGSSGGQSFYVFALDSDQSSGPKVDIDNYQSVLADQWTLVEIPLADLVADQTLITGISFQENDRQNWPTMYLDEIYLVSHSPPGAPSVDSWDVHPWAIPADGLTQTVINAQVSDSQDDLPLVTIDLSSLGGSNSEVLYDDGDHNDGEANDGLFGLVTTADPASQIGEIPLILQATDTQGNRTTRYIGTFVVLAPLNTSPPVELDPFLGWGNFEVSWQRSVDLPWNYIKHYIKWGWHDYDPHSVSKACQSAWNDGVIPSITIEFIRGGEPCGMVGERDCVINHLQNPTIMQGFYEQLTEAAKQAKGTQPAIINIEPDASAYVQLYSIEYDGQNGIIADDPHSVPAESLDSNYSNTYAGVVQRMVDIIHSEAPNVLVALHARTWATGPDIAVDNRANQDIDLIAWRMAHFLTEAGGPDLDLLYSNWKNVDAASDSGIWWDDTNRYLPHFNRVIYWQNLLSHYSGLRQLIFRMPVGNMNLPNVCGQYQDNRIDYAFNHTRDLYDAGIVGVIIGGGRDCRTNPSTDGGNVEAKATQYYVPPATPTGVLATLTESPGKVKVSWQDNNEFDLFGYRLYYSQSSTQKTNYIDARRQTTILFNPPLGGQWYLSVSAYDAREVEGSLSTPIPLSDSDVYFSYIPLVINRE